MIGQTIAGRYQLLAGLRTREPVRTFRGVDLETGGAIAVKLRFQGDTTRSRRFEREAEITASLDIPGVVRWLASGHEGPFHYIVTELVDGTPFPGAPVSEGWSGLRPIALRALRILAEVHRRGVLHRDLKPDNLLVDAHGAVTFLDFGLSRLQESADALTRTGDILGTARYQAPEQILADRPVDSRADLYALGAMLYEALAGAPPQAARSLGGTYASRLAVHPPSLADLVPTLPVAVARVIDAMVAPAPDSRPTSADAVADALERSAPVRPAGALPWLGGTCTEDTCVVALEANQSVSLVGLRGSGRTAILERVAARLGDRAVVLCAAERPFESLGHAFHLPPDEAAARLTVGSRIVLVDDDVDPWSLDAVRHAGLPTLWVAEAPVLGSACVQLPPLTRADLAALFVRGQEEVGELLRHRTEGLASRVVAEVGAWLAGGWAAWIEGELLLQPEAAELLRAGGPPDPRLGRRRVAELSEPLAKALAFLSVEPLSADALAGRLGLPIWEVRAQVDRLRALSLVDPGDPPRVRGDVAPLAGRREALLAAAEVAPAHLRTGLLLAAGETGAVLAAAQTAVDGLVATGAIGLAWAHAVLALGACDDPGTAPGLAESAHRLTATLGTASARAKVRALGLPPESAPLDPARFGDTAERDPPAARALLDVTTHPHVRQLYAAILAHRLGRPEDASALIATGPWGPTERLDVALLGLECALEQGSVVSAAALTDEAQRAGVPRIALAARLVEADAVSRNGRDAPEGLVADAAALGVPALLARAQLLEAVAAWRACAFDVARHKARKGADWASHAGILCHALAQACDPDPSSRALIVDAADRTENAAIAMQTRALVAIGSPETAATSLSEVLHLATKVPDDYVGAVLSSAECVAFCTANARSRRT